MYIMNFLESFLLVGLSSQLSKLLIVYTEIVQLPKPGSMKQTVICIITGTCKCLSCVSNLFCYVKFYSSPVHNTEIKLETNFSTSFDSLAICFYLAKFRALIITFLFHTEAPNKGTIWIPYWNLFSWKYILVLMKCRSLCWINIAGRKLRRSKRDMIL